MFLGRFAVAMAGKKFASTASLGTLVLSTQFADCLWPVLLLLGIEQVRIVPGTTRVTPLDFISYPISHSLLLQLVRSEEHTSELQSLTNLVCRLLLEKKKTSRNPSPTTCCVSCSCAVMRPVRP